MAYCKEDIDASVGFMACRVGVQARLIVSRNGGTRKIVYILMHNMNEWAGVGGEQSFEEVVQSNRT